MKKQILIPVLLVSCFVGGGLGSLVDSSQLQANIFTDLWENLVSKEKETEKEKGEVFWTTWQGRNLPKETQQKFMDLQNQHERDFGILVGMDVEGKEEGETTFVPGNILQSDKDTYLQTQEFRRTLSMIKVGMDSMQDDSNIKIRTMENDEKWSEVKSSFGGEEKKTDLWRELGNIIQLMQEICTKQRSDIKCK